MSTKHIQYMKSNKKNRLKSKYEERLPHCNKCLNKILTILFLVVFIKTAFETNSDEKKYTNK